MDWGADFVLQHSVSMPSVTPNLFVNLGPLGLNYVLSAGGAGYFIMPVHSPVALVAIDRNRGRHRSEMVVAINRIHWSPCPGACRPALSVDVNQELKGHTASDAGRNRLVSIIGGWIIGAAISPFSEYEEVETCYMNFKRTIRPPKPRIRPVVTQITTIAASPNVKSRGMTSFFLGLLDGRRALARARPA